MTTYNAAAWLLDRHVDAGDGGRTAFVVDGAATRLRRRCSARCGGPSTRCGARRPPRRAGRAGRRRRAGVPGLVPRRAALRRRAGAAVDDAHRRRPGGDRRRRRRRRRRASRGATPATSTRSPRPTPELRHAVVDRRRRPAARRCPTHAVVGVRPTPTRRPVAADRRPTRRRSGSTARARPGVPKGVMHRHGSPQATADDLRPRRCSASAPDDRCLSVAKLFFAYGLGNSLTFPFAVGATRDPQPAPADAAGRRRARRAPSGRRCSSPAPASSPACSTPTCPESTFASVRATVTAGEALPADLQRRFAGPLRPPGARRHRHDRGAAHLPLQPHGRRAARARAARRSPGYEAHLRRRRRRRRRPRPTRPGYLHVRGPSIATGYWSRDAATRAAFRGEWLRTGDVYTRSADGYWTFLGRNSDMIKAGGIWVSPAEVEACSIEHPDVLEAAVVGARDASRAGDDGRLRRRPARAARSTPPSIDAHCRARMAAFKRPRRVDVVDRAAEDGDRQDPALRPPRPPRRTAWPTVIVDGVEPRRRRPARGAEPRAGVPARGARLDRAVARRSPPTCAPPPAAAHARLLPPRLRPQRRRRRCPARSSYMHHEADVVLPALLGRARHRAAGPRRPQRRGLDRPAPRRRRPSRRRARAAGAPRLRRGRQRRRRSPRPATPTPTTDLRDRLARYHDDVDGTFRGWNDVWLSPAFRDVEHRGPARRRSTRRCWRSRARTTRTARRPARRHRGRRRRAVRAPRAARRRPRPPPRGGRRGARGDRRLRR